MMAPVLSVELSSTTMISWEISPKVWMISRMTERMAAPSLSVQTIRLKAGVKDVDRESRDLISTSELNKWLSY